MASSKFSLIISLKIYIKNPNSQYITTDNIVDVHVLLIKNQFAVGLIRRNL